MTTHHTAPEPIALPHTTLMRDVRTVFIREVMPLVRAPWGLVFELIQPLVFLALFGPLVVGMSEMPGMEGNGWQWFVPGILLMLTLFGTAGIGYWILMEMQGGAYERMLVTPIRRSAMLIGRCARDLLQLLGQAVIVVAVMIPFGFNISPLGALLGLALLAGVGLGMAGLAYSLALASRGNHEIYYTVQSTLLFPLIFLSGLMLPLDLGPRWMEIAGALNPLTYVAEALRLLFAGTIVEFDVALGAAMALVLAVGGTALASVMMRRG